MSQAVANDSWFKSGNAGYEHAKKIQEEQQSQYGPMRFWLKPGNSAKVTFLDTEGFYFNEHNLKINGKWGNYYTCTKDFSECPICDSGERSGYVCAYTIIDHSEYTSQTTGKVIKNQKKLLVVRPAVMNKLARRRESLEGNLALGLFIFSRDKKEECSTGEDIEFIKRMERKDVLKFKPQTMTDEEFLAPFDYMKLCAPKSVDELRRIAGQTPPVGSDSFSSAGQTSTGMPPVRGAEQTDDASIEDLL